MRKNETFTVVRHEILDSPAALTLRPGEFGTLLDAIRAAQRATKNGTQPTNTFVFCHAIIKRRISRDGFDAHRRRLIAHGFLEVVSVKRGTFRWCDKWRTYKPAPNETKPLEKQYQTNKKRAGTAPTVVREKPATEAKDVVREKPATEAKSKTLHHGAGKTRHGVREKPAVLIKQDGVHFPPPPALGVGSKSLTPPEASTSDPGRGGIATLPIPENPAPAPEAFECEEGDSEEELPAYLRARRENPKEFVPNFTPEQTAKCKASFERMEQSHRRHEESAAFTPDELAARRFLKVSEAVKTPRALAVEIAQAFGEGPSKSRLETACRDVKRARAEAADVLKTGRRLQSKTGAFIARMGGQTPTPAHAAQGAN